MTPQEAIALLTYANQIDARIQLNESNSDVWAYALKNVDYQKAKWCIREHYASHVDGGPPRSLAPGMVRARVGELSRVAEGKRAALEAAQASKQIERAPRPKGMSRFQEIMSQAGLHVKSMDDA
jgi:hypothetical protein